VTAGARRRTSALNTMPNTPRPRFQRQLSRR
jgi:hypothetical protein